MGDINLSQPTYIKNGLSVGYSNAYISTTLTNYCCLYNSTSRSSSTERLMIDGNGHAQIGVSRAVSESYFSGIMYIHMGASQKIYFGSPDVGTSSICASNGKFYINGGEALRSGNCNMTLANTSEYTIPTTAGSSQCPFIMASNSVVTGTGTTRTAKTYYTSSIYLSNSGGAISLYNWGNSYMLSPYVSSYIFSRTYMSNPVFTGTTDRNFFTTDASNGRIYIPSSTGAVRFIDIFAVEKQEYGWIAICKSGLFSTPAAPYQNATSQLYTFVTGGNGYWGTQTLCGTALVSGSCYIYCDQISYMKVTVITLSVKDAV